MTKSSRDSPASQDYRFRKAEIGDVEELVNLINSAYRGDSSRQGWTTEADLLDGQRTDFQEISELIEKPSGTMLLMENNGIVGSVYLDYVGEKNGFNVVYLGMYTIKPDMQGKGLGKILLDEAEKYCKANWNPVKIEMTVIKQRQELFEFYQRRGFQRTGRMSPFPYGQIRKGIPLRDDLEMEYVEKKL